MSAGISWAEVRDTLIDEFEYSRNGADRAVAKLQGLSSPVAMVFATWLKDGTLNGPQVGGCTIEGLVEGRGMTPPAAILAMDWLHTDHDFALETLQRHRYDEIR